jgi:hypothetical protein
MKSIAFFITSHGFGHAARACALMNAIYRIDNDFSFEIFTSVPEWFLADSLICKWHLNKMVTDVGLVQRTPLFIDHVSSIEAINAFYPLTKVRIQKTVEALNKSRSIAALCDISPLGILAAKEMNIPSFLIENFTWDWIYQQLGKENHMYTNFANTLEAYFKLADYHIHLIPGCPSTGFVHASFGPIARTQISDIFSTRKDLGIPGNKPYVYISLGGIESDFHVPEELISDDFFVVCLTNTKTPITGRHVLQLPHHSEFHTQDLLAASSLVIGKPGYSTVAELVLAGLPFFYLPRPDFPECQYLENFVHENVTYRILDQDEFDTGNWVKYVPDYLGMKKENPPENEVFQVADFILDRI